MAAATKRMANPALFVCDLQEKFKPAIHQYAAVIATTQKMLLAAKILNIPIFVTTQNRARLGETDADLRIDTGDEADGFKSAVHVDKSLFSMWTPEVQEVVTSTFQTKKMTAVIVGIESHICVTQTTLDLLREGHKVYVLADGVSSCHAEEVPVALARLRSEGAVVTTSESWLYECVGDAKAPDFKEVVKLVKESKEGTQGSLKALCSRI